MLELSRLICSRHMRAFALLLALLCTTPALAANCKTSGPGDIAIDCTPLRVQATGVLNQWTPTIYHQGVEIRHPSTASPRNCNLSGQAVPGNPGWFYSGACGIKFAKLDRDGRVRMWICRPSGCGYNSADFRW